MMNKIALAAVMALGLSAAPALAQDDGGEQAQQSEEEQAQQSEGAGEAQQGDGSGQEQQGDGSGQAQEGEGFTQAEQSEGSGQEQQGDGAEQADQSAGDEQTQQEPGDHAAQGEVGEQAGDAAEHGEEDGGGHGEGHITDYDFSFEGPFGTYDQMQLQRGLQVYTEVCSSCHGLKFVPIRTIGAETGPGMPEAQVRAYAEQLQIWDPELADGQGDFRAAKPVDHFPEGSMPNAPDLSLMAKARAGFHGPYGLGINQLVNGIGGPEYIASILTGYTGEQRQQAGTTFYENTAFPGGWIAMPQPLYGDDVVYEDDTEATLEQEAKDVSAFLMWAAEPKLATRKRAGFTGVLMLGILAVLLYLTNKRIWAPIKHRERRETPAG